MLYLSQHVTLKASHRRLPAALGSLRVVQRSGQRCRESCRCDDTH